MSNFNLHIDVLRPLKAFPRPRIVGEETRSSPAYRFTGELRHDVPHCIFQFTLEGCGFFRDAAGEHALPPGTGFLCESHDPATAYGYPDSGTEPWHFVFVAFVGPAAHLLVQDLVQRHGGVYHLPPDHPWIKRLRAFQLHDTANTCILSVSDAAALIFDLLDVLAAAQERLLEAKPDHQLVRRAQAEIDRRLTGKLQVTDVARALGVSREYLTRVFQRETALSPHQYILESKVRFACRLLLETEYSVKEIASRLGYASPTQFGRLLHRALHQTPGEFRRTNATALLRTL